MTSRERTSGEKKLLENLQNDLRLLSNESRKKHPPLKEAAESGIVKVRNASTKHDDLRLALLSESPEILEPFFLGCDTRNPKIVQICLTAIQRLITHEAVSSMASTNLISCLWNLMESGTEELKVLQTVTLALSTNQIVQGEVLAKALVLCFRLHFTKNSTTNNTASATVRQLVAVVFERLQTEDSLPNEDRVAELNVEELKVGSRIPPKSLRPCAADAFLLFQDLVQLVNADQPYWLIGLTEMTRTFGLELLESILISFPETFLKHSEFSFLLKERVCPMIIKLFSPNIKYRPGVQLASQQLMASDKPFFPITMRLLRIVSVLIQKYYIMLVTECEIFLSLVVKFLDGDKPQWQRALALEVLHKMCIQHELLKSFCESYDMKPHSTKILQDIVNALGSYIQSLFLSPSSGSQVSTFNSQNPPVSVTQGQPPALVAGMPVGPGVTPQPAFSYRSVWLPIVLIFSPGTCKPTYIENLEKLEPPAVTDGYGISVAYACLLDVVRGISMVVDGEEVTKTDEGDLTNSFTEEKKVSDQQNLSSNTLVKSDKELCKQLINSTWCGLLAALSLLLDASMDETATENILKTMQTYTNLCGQLEMVIPRDAFITAMCKASLPPHYTLTVLNTAGAKGHAHMGSQEYSSSTPTGHPSLGMYLGGSDPHEVRQQVVAVGTPLPTASLPIGAQQGPVMLTAKNLQCMRSILSLAHCHGSILGTAWHLVLTTLQHLVWILGLKPSTGGSLKAGRTTETPNAVITTAVMADLPVLSAMLSRLFESSQYLDDVALHHLIDALCKLSTESMDLAYNNREPSLFAVAKLLETGLVNLARVEVLWRPLTNHLLEVSQHPHIRMREWGAEAVTYLVKVALSYRYEPPLKERKKLQVMLLSPLQELSSIPHPDIRQKQIDCTQQVLHSNGESLYHGWPQILDVIGAISEAQGESLIRSAFQCLQLVVADFLPIMPCTCLQLCADTAAKFGSQNQELNVSLTAVGLLWNIADYLYQNQHQIREGLEMTGSDSSLPAFDELWMVLFSRLGDLCVDTRSAVRKSAGQTLFSTIGAHSSLLEQMTWQSVLWQVLFPLLDRVRNLSGSASSDKISDMGGNILIHHSRNTAQKQWAETQVLTLSGVARVFHSKRNALQKLGDFPRAWALFFEFIEGAARSKNNEVSLSGLKSFQEILNSNENVAEECDFSQPSLWSTAWKVWYNIGIDNTKPPPDHLVEEATAKNDLSIFYIPSQPFLTALVQIFPLLFNHIKPRFVGPDFKKLATVLHQAVAVPVHGEASPFILPSLGEVVLTSLQLAILQAIETVQKEALSGSENIRGLIPSLYQQLLVFVSYSCHAPPYGKLHTRQVTNLKNATTDWVTMNFVPFGEKALEMVVALYQETAAWTMVRESSVLHSIIKTLRLPLGMKYSCPSQSTWKLAVDAFLKVLHVGLPLAQNHPSQFKGMWCDLGAAIEDFLFSNSLASPTQSLEDQQCDEALDCKVVQLIREEILPQAKHIPKDFILKIVSLLNKGSIHSATGSPTVDTESSRKLREEFAKSCFETLLQFSFLSGTADTEPLEGSTLHGGVVNKLAVTSLLHRFQEVIKKYVEDERLSGKCPLPRHRMAEISFVLKAVATLTSSLKKAPAENVEWSVWQQLIGLYPHLVDCTTSTSAQVCRSLREALHEYVSLLSPPHGQVINGNSS
ncbi:mon2 homolog, regulator of endosome-to-Golgi trafficking isoform X2 [Tachypleus tridentatus]|uniref:mon2 homolog, regulator of endosome-to-Golgi trafficking isoform X2 n=1 Tax=Tachypleus tridentatus TaxID=6853 RepID=UPI003FD0ABEF